MFHGTVWWTRSVDKNHSAKCQHVLSQVVLRIHNPTFWFGRGLQKYFWILWNQYVIFYDHFVILIVEGTETNYLKQVFLFFYLSLSSPVHPPSTSW